MKVFIALALLSVALANPLVRPVILPEAPLPALEPYIPMAVLMDINPKLVPQDVTDIQKLTDFSDDALKFVEVAENNEAEAVATLAEEIPAEPVKFVDVAENQEVPVAASDIVKKLVAAVAEEIPAEQVKFVEFAENNEAQSVAPLAEEIPAEPVNFVDVAENDIAPVAANAVAALAEEIAVEAVKFVAENIEVAPVAPIIKETVRVVDSPPRYPGKTFDNPMMRLNV